MKHFLKLVNFEVNRFSRMYFVIVAIIIIGQIFIVFKEALREASYYGGYQKLMSPEQVLKEEGFIYLSNVMDTFLFVATIALGAVGLLFYVFFIWYRDWFAKETFAYRLLTLPVSRMKIYFAKLTTILLMVFGLIGVQLGLMLVHIQIFKFVIPKIYQGKESLHQIIGETEVFHTFLPIEYQDFFIYYGLGTMFVVMVFTCILLERSFKFIGLLFAVPYIGLMLLILSVPQIIQLIFERNVLYSGEAFVLQVCLTILVIIISLLFSRYLINKKVTV